MWALIPFLLLSTLCTINGQNNGGVRCLECHNAKTPDACDNWVMCGRSEICYTREVIDFNDNQLFHMGCEDKARCDLFVNTKLLIGKRGFIDLDLDLDLDLGPDLEQWDPDRCYQCCPQDDCNSRLCQTYIGGHTATNTSGSKPTANSCPPSFVKGPNSCYYVGNWTLSWDNARQDCQRRGAELVSVDSQVEQDFLVNYLNNTNTHSLAHTGYWTGGLYVYATKQWIWLDMSKVTYTNWGPSEPSSSSYNTRLSLHNPHTYPTYTNWKWSSQTYTNGQGFICERDFV